MSSGKSRGRVPRPVRRMGTEIHEDTRTQRERSRGDAERAAIEGELEEWAEDLEAEILDVFGYYSGDEDIAAYLDWKTA